jgi:hypothetical protein
MLGWSAIADLIFGGPPAHGASPVSVPRSSNRRSPRQTPPVSTAAAENAIERDLAVAGGARQCIEFDRQMQGRKEALGTGRAERADPWDSSQVAAIAPIVGCRRDLRSSLGRRGEGGGRPPAYGKTASAGDRAAGAQKSELDTTASRALNFAPRQELCTVTDSVGVKPNSIPMRRGRFWRLDQPPLDRRGSGTQAAYSELSLMP